MKASETSILVPRPHLEHREDLRSSVVVPLVVLKTPEAGEGQGTSICDYHKDRSPGHECYYLTYVTHLLGQIVIVEKNPAELIMSVTIHAQQNSKQKYTVILKNSAAQYQYPIPYTPSKRETQKKEVEIQKQFIFNF